MSIQRRLAMLGATTLVMLGLTAVPALAEHPDFPYGDTDPESWSAVTAHCGVECSFDTGINNEWRVRWPYDFLEGICYGGIEGTISFDGTVEVTDGTLWSPYVYNVCARRLTDFPWQGTVCAHKPTGKFWVRQNLNFDFYGEPTLHGVTFGLAHASGVEFSEELDWTTIAIQDPEYEWAAHEHRVFFPWSVDFEPEELPCGWPELRT